MTREGCNNSEVMSLTNGGGGQPVFQTGMDKIVPGWLDIQTNQTRHFKINKFVKLWLDKGNLATFRPLP